MVYNGGMKKGWLPPRSAWGLIQEDLVPNEWLILVSCIMLNQTTRKQVEKVLPEFMKRWSSPEEFVNANPDDVSSVIKPLGFGNRRLSALCSMTRDFLDSNKEVSSYSGIGAYGKAAHDVFCEGKLPREVRDHALVQYVSWVKTRHVGSTLSSLFEELGEELLDKPCV